MAGRSPLRTSDFDYDLPEAFIAQTPIEPRDSSRLLVLDRRTGEMQHRIFRDVVDYLRRGDLLVLNETRVLPARLRAVKPPGGGALELLLLKKLDSLTWEVLVGGKGARTGRRLSVEAGPDAEVVAELNGPLRRVRFSEPIEPHLPAAGHVPLPPYIKAGLADPERYQTVFARQPGSAAAPTAGLHFTPRLLEDIREKGVKVVTVVLHVGLDTFKPVEEEDPLRHTIHTEWCRLNEAVAEAVNRTRQAGGKIFAVGTTAVRTLESAARIARPGQVVSEFEGPTDLFILPGFQFKAVDSMITNFHLPRSTLIMLVSAFASREAILGAYEVAKNKGYRFYSFGDAMLIL
jgi:S-adenosylmethionine:tRNA ribosyltransferase-isomerase